MKKTLFIFLVFFSIQTNAQENNLTTTYYFIRHAEKDRTDTTNKNPELTKKGLERAENWKTTFENVTFDMVFSTNYLRTIQTAMPTALSKNLEIQFYDPSNLYDENFKTLTKGKTVLIVGHSNTTPQFVNAILGEKKYEDIDDTNNANLYIVTITNGVINSILLKVK